MPHGDQRPSHGPLHWLRLALALALLPAALAFAPDPAREAERRALLQSLEARVATLTQVQALAKLGLQRLSEIQVDSDAAHAALLYATRGLARAVERAARAPVERPSMCAHPTQWSWCARRQTAASADIWCTERDHARPWDGPIQLAAASWVAFHADLALLPVLFAFAWRSGLALPFAYPCAALGALELARVVFRM